jgi:hypothetical protein
MKSINDIGVRFGMLLVIEEVKIDKSSRKRYICLCECGNTHEALSSHLRAGRITHCGCEKYKGEKHTQWGGVGEISGNFWYNHIIRSANGSKNGNRERKSKELTIDIEYAWNLFLKQNRKCALSGIELNFPKVHKDKNYNASLDRINSNIGYVEGNVQWVHKDVNMMKNKYDQNYFIEICKLITKHNEN